MSSPTLDLIVRPAHGWRRIRSAEPEPWPAPLLGAGGVALWSVLAAAVGTALATDGASVVGDVTVALLLATAGYVGAVACGVQLAARWLEKDHGRRPRVARFAAWAVLPVTASGVAGALPWKEVWWIAAAVGCALTGWSATLGARRYLEWTGSRAHRTAAIVAALASLPPLAATAVRAAATGGG
ncbi:MAG: Yip1 family protein [Myxococcales bacterium]|jgi:hypothetical protein